MVTVADGTKYRLVLRVRIIDHRVCGAKSSKCCSIGSWRRQMNEGPMSAEVKLPQLGLICPHRAILSDDKSVCDPSFVRAPCAMVASEAPSYEKTKLF